MDQNAPPQYSLKTLIPPIHNSLSCALPHKTRTKNSFQLLGFYTVISTWGLYLGSKCGVGFRGLCYRDHTVIAKLCLEVIGSLVALKVLFYLCPSPTRSLPTTCSKGVGREGDFYHLRTPNHLEASFGNYCVDPIVSPLNPIVDLGPRNHLQI